MTRASSQPNRDQDNDSWRVFCAISLPETVRARLDAHMRTLRQAFPNAHASWSRAENVHLTLKFLGETKTLRLEKLFRAATRAVEGMSPFQLTIEETGAFPKRGMPRVLWIGVKDESADLARLHARLEDACFREGFARGERQFRPHLTLARMRKPQFASSLASAHEEMPFEAVEVTVTELLVIRSELNAEGSRYTVISRHALGSSTMSQDP